MPLNIFDKQIRQAGKDLIKASKDSLDWYKEKVTRIVKKDPSKLFQKNSIPKIGHMFIFVYDAKYKDTLPFFDAFPLVIPIEFYQNGFLGLNLHYLDASKRTMLLTALKDLARDKNKTEKNKLNISYELLSRYASSFPGHEKCVKRYLYGHVKTSFHEVDYEDWDKVSLLPAANWKVNTKYSGPLPY